MFSFLLKIIKNISCKSSCQLDINKKEIFKFISKLDHNEFKSFKVDEIFLLMFLPGIDMLRLFTQRILSGKNPFLGDREHLHHYFLLIYSYKYAIFSIILSIFKNILIPPFTSS